MALTQASLKGKLITEIGAVLSIIDAAQLDKVCGAIAKAVVDEVTANATVPAGIAVQVNIGTGTGATTGVGTVA